MYSGNSSGLGNMKNVFECTQKQNPYWSETEYEISRAPLLQHDNIFTKSSRQAATFLPLKDRAIVIAAKI